jgi:lantibiotic modifying enzyme
LTGLSHGAAGIGLALFELYAATGRPHFLETARGAFAYEDTFFDPRAGNWRDLRLTPRILPFARAWCHGAPGIALSRLRAAALDPERSEAYLIMARKAIATTLDSIEEKLATPKCDATPCNGLTGLIEIVWIAAHVLEERSYRIRALSAAEILTARHAASGDWPSGAPSGGPNPSLMLGTAGIGYTFLRLHDPDRVPSILWVGC